MKKVISAFLVAIFLLMCVPLGPVTVSAAPSEESSRAIAIVFDNSGSMYDYGDQSWCRATYATEVFASMLNPGDTLTIYPMNPIKIEGSEYSMNNPFKITDSSQASKIRDIYTEGAGSTHIESVDCAISGLQSAQADKKYLIVLSDGESFCRNGIGLGQSESRRQLDECFQTYAGEEMTMMYLGIGDVALVPNTPDSEYFVKKLARNTSDVISVLTEMCNQIFGRDTLPRTHISGKEIDFDISLNKLIVFVQGDNISNLTLTGGSGQSVGQPVSTQQAKYSTRGCSAYQSVADTSLQGMIVTYTNLDAGKYKLNYDGTATNVEVYYEPNADLDFVFTDAEGNTVDSNALYQGEYKVTFGMKDAKTGELITSDLLSNAKYQGSYSINGTSYPISHSGYSGEVQVTLHTGDKFEAELTVTYLSGYSITKDSGDFGWPSGGVQVAAHPPKDLKLVITGGDELYTLKNLENGAPYIATIYYDGVQLTGEELEKVSLKWDPSTSNAEIKQEFADDHYKLTLHYKDPAAPQNTKGGTCAVDIYAYYTAQDCAEAKAQTSLSYNIKDTFGQLKIELEIKEDYIVISDLDNSKEIIAKLTINGEKLAPEDFETVDFKVDCGGIKHTVTPNPEDSSYTIKLLSTEGIGAGDYSIKAKASYTDSFGRSTQTEEAKEVTLSHVPLWVIWLAWILLLLLLIIIIWLILHIRVLPKRMHTTRKSSSMNFDGDDVTQSTNFLVELKKNRMKAQAQYGGRKFGVSMDVTPGKESYLYKSDKRKSAVVKVESVKKFGPAKIQEAMIGSTKYVLDEDSGKFAPALSGQKPFTLTNGMTVKYSGTIQDAGIDKDFEVISKLNFKKK